MFAGARPELIQPGESFFAAYQPESIVQLCEENLKQNYVVFPILLIVEYRELLCVERKGIPKSQFTLYIPLSINHVAM